jgi:quinol monooxygenase YgiN
MFSLIANLYAEKNKVAQLKDALLELGRGASREPGCVYWALNVREDDPTVLVCYEVYRDDAAFNAHMESEHSKRFLGTYNGQKLGRAEIEVIRMAKVAQ